MLGSGTATLRTEAGNVEVRNGAKLAVPGGNVLVQGGGAELILEDGDTTVAGAVTLRGTWNSQFRLDTYDSLDKGTSVSLEDFRGMINWR